MPLGVIQVITCDGVSLIFKAGSCSIMWVHQVLFTHPPIEEHLGYFPRLTDVMLFAFSTKLPFAQVAQKQCWCLSITHASQGPWVFSFFTQLQWEIRSSSTYEYLLNILCDQMGSSYYCKYWSYLKDKYLGDWVEINSYFYHGTLCLAWRVTSRKTGFQTWIFHRHFLENERSKFVIWRKTAVTIYCQC